MACNPDGSSCYEPKDIKEFKIHTAELLVFDEEACTLYRDFKLIADIASSGTSFRSSQAMGVANEIMNLFDRAPMSKAQKVANDFLNAKNGEQVLKMTAVGHCHIDTAWLWTFDETKRKCARSWASQLVLMNDHANFKFVCSQMQQLEWLKVEYPTILSRLQERAKKGQFIPIGGSWVEMDGNMPSGESYVRQFLYGQRFQKQHFGTTSKIFWLPGKIPCPMSCEFL
jgi:alpha-mannosidase